MKRLFACIFVCLGLSACATPNHMGISTASTSVDVSQKSLLLMTISLSHPGSPDTAPKLSVLYVERPHAQDKADRQNFISDKQGRATSEGRTTYEMRMAIAPGNYTMVAASGFITVFPLVAQWESPLELDFTVPPNSVLYLGHIEVSMRPMHDGDFRAGPVLPLLQQSALGVTGSTFDVAVSDDSAQDLPQFRSEFPVLQNADIKTQILPPFDRARAFNWWKNLPL